MSETAPRIPDQPHVNAVYKGCHAVAHFVTTLGLGLRAYGTQHVPRTGGALIASNHQSYLDPVLFGGALARPIDYFARRSLFHGAFGRFIAALNALPVERDGRDVGAIRVAIERLRAGRALLLFPEGTRTTNGEVGPFEPGVVALARRAGVPVVPAAVSGAFDAWPRGQALFTIGAPCAVSLGRPIPPEEPDLLERLRTEVVALKREADRRWTLAGRRSAC